MPDARDANDGDEVDQPVNASLGRDRDARVVTDARESRFIDFTHVMDLLQTAPAPRKVLLMVLVLCLKDQASEVRFEPCETESGERGLRMVYAVAGAPYELVPPPPPAAPQVLDELERLAELRSWRTRIGALLRRASAPIGRRPNGLSSGGFRMGYGGHVCEVTVTVNPSPLGDRIVLQFSAIDSELSRLAAASLQEMYAENRRTRSQAV